jgi:hypothetical protein
MTDITAGELFHFMIFLSLSGSCILHWREPLGEYTAKWRYINPIGRLTDIS